jgi:hypothetical protein
MFRCHLGVTFLIIYSFDRLLILEFHQLEEAFTGIESDTFDNNGSMPEVAEDAPFLVYLMNPDALVSRIRLQAPIFRVVLANKIGYAIETHKC